MTAIGVDRVGIDAGVTRALYETGCNLEDATSTILRGHFAMMLVVRAPEDTGAGEIEAALARPADELALVITVRPVEEARPEPARPTHMISVYGADRPGIVYHVSDLLARLGVNVTDMTSRVIGSEEAPVYALMLEAVVQEGTDLDEGLAELRAELGVEASVHPIEADVL